MVRRVPLLSHDGSTAGDGEEVTVGLAFGVSDHGGSDDADYAIEETVDVLDDAQRGGDQCDGQTRVISWPRLPPAGGGDRALDITGFGPQRVVARGRGYGAFGPLPARPERPRASPGADGRESTPAPSRTSPATSASTSSASAARPYASPATSSAASEPDNLVSTHNRRGTCAQPMSDWTRATMKGPTPALGSVFKRSCPEQE